MFRGPRAHRRGLTGKSMGHGVSGVQLHRCLNPAVTQEPCLFDGEAIDLPSDVNIRSFFLGTDHVKNTQRVQTLSDKVSKFWRANARVVTELKLAKRVGLQCSCPPHTK